jgi:hypothetical protein
MDDEDAPPELVDVTAFPESLDNKEEKAGEREKETGELISRVPITLVTGRQAPCQAALSLTLTGICLRIPGSWQDNSIELHPYRETWQENCCYYEWCD